MSALYRWGVWLLVVGASFGVLLGFLGTWRFAFDTLGYFRIHFGILALAGAVLAVPLPRWRVKWIGFGAAALAFATLGPVWSEVERPAPTGVETRRVTVMTANMLVANPTVERSVAAILAADPDVVAIMETPSALMATPSALHDRYPYRSLGPPPFVPRVTLWSKLPLQRATSARTYRELPAYVTAHVALEGAGFTLTAVHLSWPLVKNGAQEKQIARLPDGMLAEPGEQVLVGDFNAPPWSEAMRRVQANTGLSLIGGWRRTWVGHYPNPVRYLWTGELYGREIPSLLGHHIDHVLVSDGIGVEQIEVIPLPGSDHLAVWTVLQVPLREARRLFAGG